MPNCSFTQSGLIVPYFLTDGAHAGSLRPTISTCWLHQEPWGGGSLRAGNEVWKGFITRVAVLSVSFHLRTIPAVPATLVFVPDSNSSSHHGATPNPARALFFPASGPLSEISCHRKTHPSNLIFIPINV